VAASGPEPSEVGSSVGASEGGGKSELPEALEGVRTAAPPSACAGASLSRRGLPCSPMGYLKMARDIKFSRRGGKPGPTDPPAAGRARHQKYIPHSRECQRILCLLGYPPKGPPCRSRIHGLTISLHSFEPRPRAPPGRFVPGLKPSRPKRVGNLGDGPSPRDSQPGSAFELEPRAA
jgi:hypothetical protein